MTTATATEQQQDELIRIQQETGQDKSWLELRRREQAEMLARIATALKMSLAEAEAYVAGYGKPAWYICYRLDCGIDLKAPFPRIEK